MKSGMTITEQVLEVMKEELKTEINLDTLYLCVPKVDTNVIRELIMRLEEEFEIEIADEDAEKLLTVKDIVDYIIKKRTLTEPEKKEEPKKEEKKDESIENKGK